MDPDHRHRDRGPDPGPPLGSRIDPARRRRVRLIRGLVALGGRQRGNSWSSSSRRCRAQPRSRPRGSRRCSRPHLDSDVGSWIAGACSRPDCCSGWASLYRCRWPRAADTCRGSAPTSASHHCQPLEVVTVTPTACRSPSTIRRCGSTPPACRIRARRAPAEPARPSLPVRAETDGAGVVGGGGDLTIGRRADRITFGRGANTESASAPDNAHHSTSRRRWPALWPG